MKTKKLFELLILTNGVICRRWQILTEVVNCIEKKYAKINKKEWLDSFKKNRPEFYPLDLSRIETWTTYDGCHELFFYVEDEKLMCEATIYNGDNMTGNRKGIRFKATILMPDEFLPNIKENINSSFDDYLEHAYKTHLQSKKIDWINKMKEEILQK